MPWQERFPIHEIRRIDGGRGFQTGKNVFRIGGNTFYSRKNKILMKIPESKSPKIGIIAEFCGIPNGFPNLASSGGLLTVLPLTPVRSSPKIRLAFFTAFSVMMQLDIMFEHTIPRNSQSVGCPNIPCHSWAAFATSTSGLVKPSMLF
jgi:hypothetical protein